MFKAKITCDIRSRKQNEKGWIAKVYVLQLADILLVREKNEEN